ncbi:MAG: hypothetical protein JWM34_1020 [Ilumatobacteraceae bacterium]|nr:hypothetical protein [Ilumatobacteraceae bacterium]
MTIGLLCASFAWSGWVFLHSVGDPHRAERIATSILDNPAARAEIAAPLADQIVQNFSLPVADKATIAATVADVLGDPNIVGNFIAAFGSAQANALGVNDPRPTTIDAGALINAIRDRLAPTQPELAALIPTSTATIDLPKVQSPVISDARSLADTWTLYLGLIAVAIVVLCMVFGDRRWTLRSYGFWAIFTGAFWAIGPRLAPWLVHHFAPQADAVVGATVDAVAGPITFAATLLVVSGIAALVVRYTVFAQRRQPDGSYAPPGVAYAPGQAGVMQPAAAGYVPASGLTRTDQVPVQYARPEYAQPQYAQPQYAQPQYAQPTAGQPQYVAPQYAQPQYAQPQFAQPTGVQPQYVPNQYASPPPSPYEQGGDGRGPAAPHRSTPIPDSQDELARSEAVPLLIRPLDLPTSSDLMFPPERHDGTGPH